MRDPLRNRSGAIDMSVRGEVLPTKPQEASGLREAKITSRKVKDSAVQQGRQVEDSAVQQGHKVKSPSVDQSILVAYFFALLAILQGINALHTQFSAKLNTPFALFAALRLCGFA